MRTDDRGVYSLKSIISKPYFSRNIAAQIVGNDMRIRDQPVQNLLPLIGTEIERQGTLVKIEALEIQTLAFAQPVRADMARGVTTFWRLDFDNVSAQLSQEHGAIRSCTILLRANYAKSFEWKALAHAGLALIHCFEMMMRCISLVPSPMHISIESRYRRSMSYSLE